MDSRKAPPLCVTCKHYNKGGHFNEERCKAACDPYTDVVTGETIIRYTDCSIQRSCVGKCTRAGILYEEKVGFLKRLITKFKC